MFAIVDISLKYWLSENYKAIGYQYTPKIHQSGASELPQVPKKHKAYVHCLPDAVIIQNVSLKWLPYTYTKMASIYICKKNQWQRIIVIIALVNHSSNKIVSLY